MSTDEVLRRFDERAASRHTSEATKQRQKRDQIVLMKREIPPTVAALQRNGYPEFPQKKYAACRATINGRDGVVWPKPFGEGERAALALYVDGSTNPPTGHIVITDDVKQGEYRTATDGDLMQLTFEVLDGTVRGLLIALRAPEKVPVHILPDEVPPSPYW